MLSESVIRTEQWFRVLRFQLTFSHSFVIFISHFYRGQTKSFSSMVDSLFWFLFRRNEFYVTHSHSSWAFSNLIDDICLVAAVFFSVHIVFNLLLWFSQTFVHLQRTESWSKCNCTFRIRVRFFLNSHVLRSFASWSYLTAIPHFLHFTQVFKHNSKSMKK